MGEPELYDCPNVWYGLEKTRALQMGVITPGDMQTSAKIRIWQTLPRALSTVTGCTEYSGTRPPAPGTGPANGTATEQFCIGGLLYNEETHACDWPQNVAGCQKHPLCKDDANGNV